MANADSPPPDKPSRQPLAFGTSGLRGLVTDITDYEAYVNTRGFMDFVRQSGDAAPGATVALAGDLRPSTDSADRSILRAVAKAVTDAGYHVENCGKIPTPALTFYALERAIPSIMVTGSHIPFDRNGIKFNKSRGEVLKSDEAPILDAVARARAEASASELFDDAGMLRVPAPALPELNHEARRLFVRRYLEFFPSNALSGLRVGLFEHTAVGRDLIADLLLELGAQLERLDRRETFVAIDTEALDGAQLEQLQGLATKTAGVLGGVDAIVSTDGDSDRPLVLGVDVDGRARFIGGDVLGILVADYLGADSITVPVTATDAIDAYFSPRGAHIQRTRVGSPWVIAAAEKAEGSRKVGWEANGGFFTFSPLERDGHTLAPLPTRDAALPILSVLHCANEHRCRLTELLDRLPKRFTTAGLLDQVPVERSRALMARLGPGGADLTMARFRGDGVDVSSGGSFAPASAASAARLRQIRAILEQHFTRALGFGPVVALNFLDGVRVTFEGGDTAHLRPSGNAPQLRIYALAGSPERARAIVDAGLAEPNGILRSLLAGS